jgi:hypothetical protein
VLHLKRAACVAAIICIGLSSLLDAGCIAIAPTAADTMRRTIPDGEAQPVLLGPVWTGPSAQFTWEFETRLSAADYIEWLVPRVRDFEVVDRQPIRLVLRKYVGGDAYQLRLTLEEGAQERTHVRGILTASPD